MFELFLTVFMRLLGVRVFTLATKELLDGLDQADARADTPEKRALIQNLVNGMLSPPAGSAADVQSLTPPVGSPPAAGKGSPFPSPLPKAPAAISPPAARRRGRPRKPAVPPPPSAGGSAVHDSQP
jgi:hypothetical protein